MTTPAQYRYQLSQIDLGSIQVEGKKPAEAQTELDRLLESQKQLQEIERAISLDMQVLRSRYHSRYGSLSSGSTGRVLESNKRRVGSQARADDLERLNTERDNKLAPLEEVKKEADEMQAKAAVMRLSLEKVIHAG